MQIPEACKIDIFKDLYEYISVLPVIDTHEHLENEWNHPDWNILSDYTRHYFSCDLISSGLAPEKIEALADPDTDIMTKWLSVEKHWEDCRYTGYGRMLDIAVQKIYGLPGLNRETVEEADARFRALRKNPGYSRHIMKEICGIETSINNIWHLNGDSDSGLYRFVTQIDSWIAPDREFFNQELEKGDLPTAESWVSRCLSTLSDDFALRGAFALKMALSYSRTLHIENPTAYAAQSAYEKWLSGSEDFAEIKPFQDYTAHAIFRWANECGLLLQIHTGYQESNSHDFTRSDPALLIPIVLSYPGIRFDIFHMGYPYQETAGAMGKMYPNVRLNMCWTHILAPAAARRALCDWLEQVPRNKIFAFGGDCLFFDGVAGHLELARTNVARALTEAVESGVMPLSDAKRTARMLFYENPKAFYGL